MAKFRAVVFGQGGRVSMVDDVYGPRRARVKRVNGLLVKRSRTPKADPVEPKPSVFERELDLGEQRVVKPTPKRNRLMGFAPSSTELTGTSRLGHEDILANGKFNQRQRQAMHEAKRQRRAQHRR